MYPVIGPESFALSVFHEAAGAFAAFVTPKSKVFWAYLLTSLVPCVAYAWARGRYRRPSLTAWWRWCFPKRIYLHPSARADYVYYLVNAVVMGAGLGLLTISSHEVYSSTQTLLTRYGVDPLPAIPKPHIFLSIVVTLACALAMDFGLFFAHYLQHKLPLLWEFHKVHHSAAVLTPITVYRMHPIDDIVAGVCAGVLGGLTPALLEHFVLPGVREVRFMGLNPVFMASYLFLYHLRHSHFWLPYPAWLSHILVSPAQHQVHHSKDPRHFDKNMGFIFAMWDHLFGTLYVPATRERLSFGLSEDEEREFSSVVKLYLLPFRKVAAKLGSSRNVETARAQ